MKAEIRAGTVSYYEFGPFRLDPTKRLLIRNGERLRLTQKAFDTLLVLVQNNERVVDKQEIMCAVWPDTIVEENNLTQSISTLRKALEESRQDHKYIVTIQGRGYRFVAHVKEVCEESRELMLLGRAGTSLVIDGPRHPRVLRPSLVTMLLVGLVALAAVFGGLYLWRINDPKLVEMTGTQSNVVVLSEYLQYTKNPQAYQAYLRGRYFWNRRTKAGLSKAVEYFQEAINADRDNALAYAGLADSYLMMTMYGYGSNETGQIAKSAALKALELDETLAEAHTSFGCFLEGISKDLPGAEREYRRAIELNPRYATARQWYGELLRSTGRFDEALIELKRAQELDPLSPVMNSSLGVSYYYARQYDLVIEQNRKALEIEPNFTSAHFGLGLAFEQKGMYDAAIAEFRRAWELSNGDEPMTAALSHAYAKAGDRAKALEVFGELKEKTKHVSAYNLALFHVAMGEKDKALPLLHKASQEDGYHVKLRNDPRLDELRSDSAFAELFKS